MMMCLIVESVHSPVCEYYEHGIRNSLDPHMFVGVHRATPPSFTLPTSILPNFLNFFGYSQLLLIISMFSFGLPLLGEEFVASKN